MPGSTNSATGAGTADLDAAALTGWLDQHVAGFRGPIGSAFYLMALVEGANFTDGALPHLTEGARTIVYHGMIDTLAALHRIDPQAAGLATFGRPGNFFERQVARWIKQYRASETDRIEVAERLIVWLPATLPPQT